MPFAALAFAQENARDGVAVAFDQRMALGAGEVRPVREIIIERNARDRGNNAVCTEVGLQQDRVIDFWLLLNNQIGQLHLPNAPFQVILWVLEDLLARPEGSRI